MPAPTALPSAASAASVKDVTTASFRQEVLTASLTAPVLVDFWAPWCGPCKQLAPILERAVAGAGGKVSLVKMNIDEHPQIAGQLGIQSIPAVIAFTRGQPVDGFTGNLPESQVKAFIERLVGPSGPGEIETLMAEAAAAAETGDIQTAASLYAAVLEAAPDHAGARGLLARLYLDAGAVEEARTLLDAAGESDASDPAIAAARAALSLADHAADLGEMPALEARLAADPADHQARYDLALALNARGDRATALDHLLAIVRADRSWNEDAARKQVLQFFDAWGPTDPATLSGRRRLSAVLFS